MTGMPLIIRSAEGRLAAADNRVTQQQLDETISRVQAERSRRVTEYAPITTEEIRNGYVGEPPHFMDAAVAAEFDRWLVEHDRQVAEQAWDEGNRQPHNNLPRCPNCGDPVSNLTTGSWVHDNRNTSCTGTSEPIWAEHNPYRTKGTEQ